MTAPPLSRCATPSSPTASPPRSARTASAWPGAPGSRSSSQSVSSLPVLPRAVVAKSPTTSTLHRAAPGATGAAVPTLSLAAGGGSRRSTTDLYLFKRPTGQGISRNEIRRDEDQLHGAMVVAKRGCAPTEIPPCRNDRCSYDLDIIFEGQCLPGFVLAHNRISLFRYVSDLSRWSFCDMQCCSPL